MPEETRRVGVEEQSQRLLQGPLKHARAAALAAALLPLASVMATPASAQATCPSGGTVSGYVWSDTNGNGIQDPTEPGISGASVTFVSSASEAQTAPTDATGMYSFGFPVTPTTDCRIRIEVQIPSGWQPTLANVGDDAFDSDGVLPSTLAVPPCGLASTATTDASVVACDVLTGLSMPDNDFGFKAPVVAQVGTGTPGYWKNHPEAWPASVIAAGGITVGGKFYTMTQALGWLDNLGKDKTTTMFSSLLSAKLNVLSGAQSSCVAETIIEADKWLAKYGPVGSGVAASSFAWKTGEPFHRYMDNYNNGMYCAPHRD